MSYRDVIIDKLTALQEPYEEVIGSEWIKVRCTNPEHDDAHPSAGVNVESGILHCFSCKHVEMYVSTDDSDITDPEALWKAKYTNLKKNTVEVASIQEALETVKDRKYEVFLPPVTRLLDSEWRGISAELLQDAQAYYCATGKYQGRYVFPAYEGTQLQGFDARIVDASARMIGAKWIRNRGFPVKDTVYPLNTLKRRFTEVGGLGHIIICEGVMDALSCIEMGVPAIASFGLSPPNQERILKLIRLGVTSVSFGFDNDEAGRAGVVKLYEKYAEWFDIEPHPLVQELYASEHKDFNDLLLGRKGKNI